MATSVVGPRAGLRQVDPFPEHRLHVDAVKELKRAIVRLALCGDRYSLKLARRLFNDVPALREA
jgi:hypothetical protein